ncbi:unnamed protein product [Ilex paraguariensis]|uniref:Phytochrome kinase substrate 1 n=1 Tax=Ilex paraguariensis TaxID=185542 RepID=A0ABC8RYX8_9AQUA
MDTPTAIKAFQYNSTQQPIFTVMETPLHYRSFAQKSSPSDASFSSYLRPEELKPASQEDVGCTVDDPELSIFEAQKYFNENNDTKECRNPNLPPAINGGNLEYERCDLSKVPRLSSVSSVDGYNRNYRVRSFHATPTASSEASWNSQTGLLSNPPGSIAVSLRNISSSYHEKKKESKARKWFFCRKCPCSGKKSVQVDESPPEPRTPVDFHSNNSKATLYGQSQSPKKMEEKASIQSKKNTVTNDLVERHEKVSINSQRFSSENHFSSNTPCHQRIVGSGRSFNDVLKGLPPQPTSSLDDPPRESLEVFQPLDELIPRKSIEVQKRIANTNGDGDHRGFSFPGSPISRVTATEDDVASDASSDLFEIESFSTQTMSYPIPMYRRRDSLDEAPTFNARRLATSNEIGTLYGRRSLDEPMTPSMATTECYEPSEASIDWSVTTAEGFDRASMTNFSVTASEIEDVRISRHCLEKGGGMVYTHGGRGGGRGGGGESGKRKGNGLLLSCRHEKAVSVGPHPVKCVAEGEAEAPPPFPVISTDGHVSSRPPKPNKTTVTRSHSARLSVAFAT